MQDLMTPDETVALPHNDEMQRILVDWNRTACAYDRTETVPGLIRKQATAHPQRTAIIDGTTHVEYGRLSARAEAVASALLGRGVAPGSLVGVCMGRSWELVATLLGVLRAGCAYVPLDPDYPRERVHYMLQHSRAAAALVDSATGAALCAGVPLLLRFDETGDCTAPPLSEPLAGDLAYVIYTSGSTGQPKGVAVEHRSVVAMIRSMRELLDDGELAGVLAAASICFDPSVMEILGTLSLGGTVVLAQNVLALPDLPAADRVRTAIMVPSAMQALLASSGLPKGIRCVVLGGEALKRSLVDRLHALEPCPRVVNVYGPTEDTVYSTASEISPGTGVITIGRPVPNTRAYILDGSMRPVPVGTAGDLYLAGDQLARGYLHDPARTEQWFVTVDPDGPVPEERLYRTGDLCRWNEDGEIEFLGRADQQVKIRGFRIELEEIESAMESMRGVDGAAATVIDGEGGRKTLAAYVVAADASVTPEALRAHVATRLPRYMVPQVVMHLGELPRLPNGKLDRTRLPSPTLAREHEVHDAHDGCTGAVAPGVVPVRRISDAPVEPQHAALLAMVREETARILGLPAAQVGVDQPFDTLGLDSLDAVELSHRVGTAVGRKLPASLTHEYRTPAAVAAFLLGLGGSDAPAPATTREPDAAHDALARFQADIQAGHPPFLAAKAPYWSASDKGTLVREFKRLLSEQGRDPYSRFVRTGSAHRGSVVDASSGEEREAIVWTTNLYLGLNRDPAVIGEARAALERFGTGMGTSATASGITDFHLDFEKEFAALVGKPAGCLFPTGFTANVGAIAGLVGEGDVVIMDQLCHASIVDGARLCGATVRTFRHNNAADLESILRAEASPYRTTLVVLEGVYSMGEGTAPVGEIARTAKKYGALVLVDEAHSFGFYGPRGAGLCAAQGVTTDVDFIMTTLSKALGSLGGVIAASEEHVALLKSSSRAYVYQATTTPADIAAALTALRRLSTDDTLRDRLWDTTHYMRDRFAAAGYDLGTGDGPIVTPHFSDSETLYAIARGLYARGIHTAAVTYPIVERGRGRLRFICSASHTRADVDRTLQALIEAEREARGVRDVPSHSTGTGAASTAAISAADGAGPDRGRGIAGKVDDSTDATPEWQDVARWASEFRAHLLAALADMQAPTPSLRVTVEQFATGEAVTLRIDGRRVELASKDPTDTPGCTLSLRDGGAMNSLCSRNVQALLDSVIDGTCALSGKVQPFIWLIARLAAWQR